MAGPAGTGTSGGAPVLRAAGASYRAGGSQLVDGIDLDVHEGELLAVVGPNGAGKTTLLSLLAGDLTPTAGSIRLHGRPLGAFRPRELARRRAVMPQQTTLQFAFTVAEVVAMGRSPHPAGGSDQAVNDALQRTGTSALAARRFPTLSGGERSRVTLARVLAQDTPVVLLDEPTASLDVGHQEQVMGIARDLARRGRTVVACVHDLNLAAAYADRVAVLAGGRLAALGTPAAVLTEPVLADAFGCALRVVPHPFRDCPLILPTDPPAAPPLVPPPSARNGFTSPPRNLLY